MTLINNAKVINPSIIWGET